MTFRNFAITGAAVLALGLVAPSGLAAEKAAASRAATPSLPVASDVRIGGDEKQTRFVIDLTHKIDISAFTLADPYRVVVSSTMREPPCITRP